MLDSLLQEKTMLGEILRTTRIIPNALNMIKLNNNFRLSNQVCLSTSFKLNHGDHDDALPGTILVKFIQKDGSIVETKARDGEIALREAVKNKICYWTWPLLWLPQPKRTKRKSLNVFFHSYIITEML